MPQDSRDPRDRYREDNADMGRRDERYSGENTQRGWPDQARASERSYNQGYSSGRDYGQGSRTMEAGRPGGGSYEASAQERWANMERPQDTGGRQYAPSSGQYERSSGGGGLAGGGYAPAHFAGSGTIHETSGQGQNAPRVETGSGNWQRSSDTQPRGTWQAPMQEVSSYFQEQRAYYRPQAGSYQGRGPKNYLRSDERIREDVCQRLTEDPQVDASDIEVKVVNHEVTLLGKVPDREQRRRAEDCAEEISGVRYVQNNLRVERQSGTSNWIGSSGERPEEREIPREETAALIASDKVEGSTVYGANREKIGTIENVMLTKRSGRVAFAVLSFGGFLGMGSDHYPLPWSALKYDDELGGYIVNLTKEQLQGAPKFSQKEGWDWNNPDATREVDRYYSSLITVH